MVNEATAKTTRRGSLVSLFGRRETPAFFISLVVLVVLLWWFIAIPEGIEPAILFAAGISLMVWAAIETSRKRRKRLIGIVVGLGVVGWLLVAAPGATFTRTRLNPRRSIR